MNPGDIVEYKDEPDRWGVVTCWSDCGGCVYYKLRGMGTPVGVDPNILQKKEPKPEPPRPVDHRRKADQHWEMAGLARMDGDRADEARHTSLARKHEEALRA